MAWFMNAGCNATETEPPVASPYECKRCARAALLLDHRHMIAETTVAAAGTCAWR